MILVARLRSIAARPGGPTILALGLAVLAIPFAVAAIVLAAVDGSGDPTGMDLDLAVVMALAAVVAGALVGGTIGGLAVRRRPYLGLALAIGTAWPVALATLSIVPGLLDRPYGAVRLCFDSCSSIIRSDSALSAIGGYGVSVLLMAAIGVPAAGLLLFLGWEMGRRRRRTVQALCVAAAVVAVDAWSMWAGALAAAALVVGALTWFAPWRPVDAAGDVLPAAPPVPPGWGT